MTKVFIDGKEGTTGLRIFERFGNRPEIQLMTLPAESRKNPRARQEMLHQADVSFLCLPDDAARESVALSKGSHSRIIDTSTAHRTQNGWAYGFPELSKVHRSAIQNGTLIAVPGCHASGLIALVYPLVAAGVLDPLYPLSCHSITGYSGGGKKMIAAYEDPDRDEALKSPRPYALLQTHKHLPEMQAVCGLAQPPVFFPIVADFYAGMEVTVPLFPSLMEKKLSLAQLHALLSEHYADQKMIRVLPLNYAQDCGGFLPSNAMEGKDSMEIMVAGSEAHPVLVSRFDNLGKGASGAAIQCMNILLGLDENTGLTC